MRIVYLWCCRACPVAVEVEFVPGQIVNPPSNSCPGCGQWAWKRAGEA